MFASSVVRRVLPAPFVMTAERMARGGARRAGAEQAGPRRGGRCAAHVEAGGCARKIDSREAQVGPAPHAEAVVLAVPRGTQDAGRLFVHGVSNEHEADIRRHVIGSRMDELCHGGVSHEGDVVSEQGSA